MYDEFATLQGILSDRVRRLARGLRSGAAFLEGVAFLAIIGGVTLGIYIAAQTSTTYTEFGGSGSSHPYVATGVAIMASAAIGGIFYWCVARALRLFAEHVAFAHYTGLVDDSALTDDTHDAGEAFANGWS